MIQVIESKLNNYTDNPSEINEIADPINNLIAAIYSNEKSVTEYNMEQISKVIKEFHGKTKSSTAFLRFYFLGVRKRQLEKLNNTQLTKSLL